MQGRAGAFLLLSMTSFAQNYTAERTTDHGVPIVRLTDAARGVEVSIVPSIGNRAYEMKVHGKNILYFPQADVAEYQTRPRLSGIPFLAPWADLLNQPAFWANGKKYSFNMGLGNVRGDMPIHGLLITSPALARDPGSGRRAIGARHQPARVLEVSRPDGAMALRARVRDDVQPGGWSARGEDDHR